MFERLQLFRKFFLKSILRTIQEDYWLNAELVYNIAFYNPSDALRFLKKLGHCWKGEWQDNLQSETAEVAAKFLQQLGRSQQADEIARKYKITE